MKVTQEKLPASRIGLEIEVPPEMSKQVYDKTLRKFARDANIPGFRKGKVPIKILTSQFGPRLKAAALEELVDESIKKAIEQEEIDALGNIELRTSFEDLFANFEPGTALVVSAALDVPPEANLTQHTGLTIQAEEVPYQDKKVEEVLEDYRNRLATRVPVEGRPAQENDLAVVDFQGVLAKASDDDEETEIPGGSGTDFELELSEGRFIPGFVDGIIGMTIGETKTVQATFPDPYPQEDLAGKEAVFTVTLKEIKEKELPDLDDDFAQEVSEFETLAELRESLETRYRKEAEDKTRANKQQAMLEALVKHLEVEIPETLVSREVDYMITQTAMQLQQQGMDIKKMFTAELVEQLRGSTRPEALTRLHRTMALGEVVKKESIKVEPDELNAKVQDVLSDLENTEGIDQQRLREAMEEDLLKEKVFEWLEANNTLELVPEGTLTTDADDEAAAEQAPTESQVEAPVEAPAPEVEEEAVAEKAPVEETPTESAPETPTADEPKPAAKKTAKSKSASKSTKSKAKTETEETTEPEAAPAKTSTRKKSTRSKSTSSKTKETKAEDKAKKSEDSAKEQSSEESEE